MFAISAPLDPAISVTGNNPPKLGIRGLTGHLSAGIVLGCSGIAGMAKKRQPNLIDLWVWIRRRSKMKVGKTQADTWEAAVKLLPVAV